MSLVTLALAAATPSPAPAPSALPADISALGLVWLIVVGLIVIALFVLANTILTARLTSHQANPVMPSVVRAWIAIALVVGLIVITAATLGGTDTALRSTLVGGLVAGVGSATAYYFATKSAETAINAVTSEAAIASAVVPDLTGMALSDALATLGASNFKLVVDASSIPTAAAPNVVGGQDQVAGSSIAGNSEITVQLAAAAAQAAA